MGKMHGIIINLHLTLHLDMSLMLRITKELFRWLDVA